MKYYVLYVENSEDELREFDKAEQVEEFLAELKPTEDESNWVCHVFYGIKFNCEYKITASIKDMDQS